MNVIGRMEFMQSYFKEQAAEMYELIKSTGYECELVETVAEDETDKEKKKFSLFKKKDKVPKRHVNKETIYHIYVKKKEYDDIVDALKEQSAK